MTEVTYQSLHGDGSRTRRIAVVGAGLAGLAAAVWLAEQGHQVSLLEKRGRLGGRTFSFDVPGAEGMVDNGQHLFAGCYDALLEYVGTIGTEEHLHWDAPPFAIRTGPDRLLTARGPRWLPAVLRNTAGLSWLVWPPIPWRERPAAVRTWLRIGTAAWKPSPDLDTMTADRWFREIGVPESLRKLTLDQLVIGLLNEKPDRVSAFTFAQALHFIARRALAGNLRAGDAVWPRVSLHELFVAPAERFLRARGAEISTGAQVVDVELDDDRLTALRLADGRRIDCDAAILTLPPWSLTTLLDRGVLAGHEFFDPVRKIEPAPISSVYVWLDRPLRMVRLAENLRDTTIEWVFDTTGMHDGDHRDGYCYSLAVSASWDVVHLRNDEFVRRATESLHQHYPEARAAQVLRTKVIHQPQATFSAHPGFESLRLSQKTPIGGLFLAGDWTRTQLPSTMESAAESAKRAVDAVRDYLSLSR
ncbi:hydroxysqualene dehydroxylase HpnE [Nocardia sp. CDC186]|uniref:Hydroxysqualene dehydroxylase HpnE n=1 Tax=Nocardia implantans TaxID=3108168 RepID=A0ABU6B0H4_9NOCA|nr:MULTISPECIES: hydroxysqualene dehydroxylase HpnE [unclassified Nocardia]MBF6195299.1 FAD-dependent oxidoreductase [Nocardia beijingensis]MEA3530655.1 hydroxysqualene dehydroxylase HpnE [Nocardia sp. CDC192]MEB3513215.1 hydroxysqualene dehydroxylase HpnE [Nocardia sp. CDC186]